MPSDLSDLIGYWPLNNNINGADDLSGNGLHGTVDSELWLQIPAPKKTSTEMVLPHGKTVMMVMRLSLHQDQGHQHLVLTTSCKAILDDGYSTGDGTYWPQTRMVLEQLKCTVI